MVSTKQYVLCLLPNIQIDTQSFVYICWAISELRNNAMQTFFSFKLYRQIIIHIQYINTLLERKQSNWIPACLFQHHSLSMRHFLQYLNIPSTWPFHFWKQTSSLWRRNASIAYKSKSPAAALALFIITAVCSLTAHWDATSGVSRLGSLCLYLRSIFPAEQHTTLKETCKRTDLWLVKTQAETFILVQLVWTELASNIKEMMATGEQTVLSSNLKMSFMH